MRILIFILFLFSFSNVNAKVYKIKLDNNNWIKTLPHVYTEADWAGTEWFCGASNWIDTVESDWRKDKKNLMGVKLSKENKKKHIKAFESFLRYYINQDSYSACPYATSNSIETWFDYKNKIMGVFKAIQYDRASHNCMIYQSLIQKDIHVRTRVSMVCKNSYDGSFRYEFTKVPWYFKIDLDSFKRLNE